MKLQPLGKNIIFAFVEDTSQGRFVPKSGGKIVIAGQNIDQNRDPKWGKVILVGPDVKQEDVKVGQYILVEPLMWSPGFEHEGVKLWKTDSTKVMATSEVPVNSF
jgi:co-chaperonin GroES (HSP10)